MSDTPTSTAAADGWKQYPFAIGDDPELVFPGAEGSRGGPANRYAVTGRLTGRTSGAQWAFLVVLSGNNCYGRFHTDFSTVSLFDLASGAYATSTERDFPRLLQRRVSHRLHLGAGALDVAYHGDVGETSLRSRRDESGALAPFAYALRAAGQAADGRAMSLELELDATKPPIPIGGNQYRGLGTWMGRRETHAYFQSALRMRGTLSWGDLREEVDGDCGWIDHQWSTRPIRWGSRRYAHERKQIHLDNGIEIAVWTQIDRRRTNRVVPYSGATAAGPRGEVDATTGAQTELLSFARDPATPEGEPPRYFADRHRLLIPSWDLDLVAEPIVASPAHADPLGSWNGPTLLRGTLGGRAVTGFGFHERTHVLTRDFELAEVLRRSLRHLPADAAPAAAALADLAWELDAMVGQGDHEAAVSYLDAQVQPAIDALPEPHRARLRAVADDTREALLRWWVRPHGTPAST